MTGIVQPARRGHGHEDKNEIDEERIDEAADPNQHLVTDELGVGYRIDHEPEKKPRQK